MTERISAEAVEDMAHLLWIYGALSFKDEYEGAYGLDELPEGQRKSFRDLARNIMEDKNLWQDIRIRILRDAVQGLTNLQLFDLPCRHRGEGKFPDDLRAALLAAFTREDRHGS